MVGPVPTVMEKASVAVAAVGVAESVTVTVKVEVPVVVGVPVMAPVVGFRLRLPGSDPSVTDQW